jgi:hypothetical protein
MKIIATPKSTIFKPSSGTYVIFSSSILNSRILRILGGN